MLWAVMRRLVFAGMAVAALAGCATPAPTYGGYSRPSGTPPPLGPSIYTNAPRAVVNSQLFACSFNGSNIGDLGPHREAVLYTPYIDTPAGPLLRDPTESACLSSGFGWRGSASGSGREHTGLDLASAEGGWIFAAADGRVVSNDWRNGYGLVLELDHGRGVRTFYAHLNEVDPRLAPGARVSSGEAVARMGATGNATGIHLHYEVTIDGLRVDPLRYGAPPPPPVTNWVSLPAPEPAAPVIAAPVAQTFDPPAPIEYKPSVEDVAPPPVAAPPAVADPYARSPYDAYRAQTQSPYDTYQRMNGDR